MINSSDATWKPPAFKYAFSLAGNVQAKDIGTSPTGTLIDIDYTNVAVTTKDSLAGLEPMGEPWKGITGRVVAGSDWATVRTDGVVEFNGRFTIQTDEHDDGPGLLINVVLSGVVDLLTAYTPEIGDKREFLLQKWNKDEDAPRDLFLNLGARFELAQASEPWAAKEYPQKGFEKYLPLVQSPFLASGTAKLSKGLLSRVEIHILQVHTPP